MSELTSQRERFNDAACERVADDDEKRCNEKLNKLVKESPDH